MFSHCLSRVNLSIYMPVKVLEPRVLVHGNGDCRDNICPF